MLYLMSVKTEGYSMYNHNEFYKWFPNETSAVNLNKPRTTHRNSNKPLSVNSFLSRCNVVPYAQRLSGSESYIPFVAGINVLDNPYQRMEVDSIIPYSQKRKTTYSVAIQLMSTIKTFSQIEWHVIDMYLRKMNTQRLYRIASINLAVHIDDLLPFSREDVIFNLSNTLRNDAVRSFEYIYDDVIQMGDVTVSKVQFKQIIEMYFPHYLASEEMQYFLIHWQQQKGRKATQSNLPIDTATHIVSLADKYRLHLEIIERVYSGEKLGAIVKDIRQRENLSISSMWANNFIRGNSCKIFWDEIAAYSIYPPKGKQSDATDFTFAAYAGLYDNMVQQNVPYVL